MRGRRNDPGPLPPRGSAWLPGAEERPVSEPVTEIPQALLGAPPAPPAAPERTFDDWLAEGRRRGWVSPAFCAMHHAEPMTGDERARMERGEDPCTPGCVRLWPLTDHAHHEERDTLPESGGNPTQTQEVPNG